MAETKIHLIQIRLFEIDDVKYEALLHDTPERVTLFMKDKFTQSNLPPKHVISVERLATPNVPGTIHIDYLVTLSHKLKWKKIQENWLVDHTWISRYSPQEDSYEKFSFPLANFSLGALIDDHIYHRRVYRLYDEQMLPDEAIVCFLYDKRETTLYLYFSKDNKLHRLELSLSNDIDPPFVVHYYAGSNIKIYVQLRVVPKLFLLKKKLNDTTKVKGKQKSVEQENIVFPTPSEYLHMENVQEQFFWERLTSHEMPFGRSSTLELELQNVPKQRLDPLHTFLKYINDTAVYCWILVRSYSENSTEPYVEDLIDFTTRNFELYWTFQILLNYGFLVTNYIENHPEFAQLFRTLWSTDSQEKLVNSLVHLYYLLSDNRYVDLTKSLRNIYSKVSSLEINYEELGLKQVRSMVITPTRRLYFPAMPVPSNRILRQYDSDYCLRLSFKDDNYSSITYGGKICDEVVNNTLKNGINIHDRKYRFVGCSTSQLRSHGVWLYAKDVNGRTADTIRAQMGTFNDKCVATKVARRGQCFSSSTNGPSNMVSGGDDNKIHCLFDDEVMPDIEHDGHNFSDGAGTISPDLAIQVAEHMKSHTTPHSVYQIRYGGAKGTVSVDNTLTGLVLRTRKSMNKFVTSHKVLEICKESKPVTLHLNHESIMLLEQLEHKPEKQILADLPDDKLSDLLKHLQTKVRANMLPSLHKCTVDTARDTFQRLSTNSSFRRLLLHAMKNQDVLRLPPKSLAIINNIDLDQMHDVLISLHETALHNLLDVLIYDAQAAEMLSNNTSTKIHYPNLVKCGFSLTTDPFFRRVLLLILYKRLEEIKTKARIPLPQGYNLLGTVDEYSVLEYGQVFVQITGIGVIKSDVIMTKFPAMHVGDMRRLTAVDVPELHHLTNCVVFPQKGKRPHPHEMAGSDLDGDEYFVTWNPQLLECFQKDNQEPYQYPQKSKKLINKSKKMSTKDECNFIGTYIRRDNVGVISNAMKVFGDNEDEGLFSKRCQDLMDKHSDAVDFIKSGYWANFPHEQKPHEYPDFMCKQGVNPVYESQRVLGHMYRTCRVLDDMVYKSIKSDTLARTSELVANAGKRNNELLTSPTSRLNTGEGKSGRQDSGDGGQGNNTANTGRKLKNEHKENTQAKPEDIPKDSDSGAKPEGILKDSDSGAKPEGIPKDSDSGAKSMKADDPEALAIDDMHQSSSGKSDLDSETGTKLKGMNNSEVATEFDGTKDLEMVTKLESHNVRSKLEGCQDTVTELKLEGTCDSEVETKLCEIHESHKPTRMHGTADGQVDDKLSEPNVNIHQSHHSETRETNLDRHDKSTDVPIEAKQNNSYIEVVVNNVPNEKNIDAPMNWADEMGCGINSTEDTNYNEIAEAAIIADSSGSEGVNNRSMDSGIGIETDLVDELTSQIENMKTNSAVDIVDIDKFSNLTDVIDDKAPSITDLAESAYQDYSGKLKQIMEMYGVQTEAEVVSGMIVNLHQRFTMRGDDIYSYINTINVLVADCRRSFRSRFFQEIGTTEEKLREVDRDVYARASGKARAWYDAAYTRPDSDRFLSFGWIMSDLLCETKVQENQTTLIQKIYESTREMYVSKQHTDTRPLVQESEDPAINTMIHDFVAIFPLLYFCRCFCVSFSKNNNDYMQVVDTFMKFVHDKVCDFPLISVDMKTLKSLNDVILHVDVHQDCHTIGSISAGQLLLQFLKHLASQSFLKNQKDPLKSRVIHRYAMRVYFKLAVSCDSRDALNTQSMYMSNVSGYKTPYIIPKDTWTTIKTDGSAKKIEEDMYECLKHLGATSVRLVDSEKGQGKLLLNGSFDSQLVAEQIASHWFWRYSNMRNYKTEFDNYKMR